MSKSVSELCILCQVCIASESMSVPEFKVYAYVSMYAYPHLSISSCLPFDGLCMYVCVYKHTDWPTSVLCGILRLPLLKMLLGTSPILVPIIFCVLTGGSMVKAAIAEGTDSIWPALSTVFGVVAVTLLSGRFCLCVFTCVCIWPIRCCLVVCACLSFFSCFSVSWRLPMLETFLLCVSACALELVDFSFNPLSHSP